MMCSAVCGVTIRVAASKLVKYQDLFSSDAPFNLSSNPLSPLFYEQRAAYKTLGLLRKCDL